MMAIRKMTCWCLVVPLATVALWGIDGCSSPKPKLGRIECELHYGARSMGVSNDGRHVAVGAKTDREEDASLVLNLNSQSLNFTGVSARVSQWVSQIEFVSNEFGFLLGCSIDPLVAGREEWPIVPGRLERFGLDGTRQVVVDSIPSAISSLSVSPDRQLVAVCSSAITNANSIVENADGYACCRVYSVSDGSLISTFVAKNSETVKLLRAVFVQDGTQCLVISQPMHWANAVDKMSHAYLVGSRNGEVLQEVAFRDDPAEIYGLVSSPETGEAFVAVYGEIGRFTFKNGMLEYASFYKTGAFRTSFVPSWIDYHAGTGRLAVGESYGGSRERAAVRIIDVKTRKAFETRIDDAGQLMFAPDGKAIYVLSGGIRKYFLDQLR